MELSSFGPTGKYTGKVRDDGYESCTSSPHNAADLCVHLSGDTIKTSVITPLVQQKNADKSQIQDDLLQVQAEEVPCLNNTVKKVRRHDVEDDGRETWSGGADFLLSIIGFAVDLANVWRFPYLCYRNGGGAFLVPYTLMMIFGAVPLFYMELVLGQYSRQGPISVWGLCPLFKGVGFCAVMIAFFVSFYYNVIIAWALYFLANSFTSDLPWIFCNNTWNTEYCVDKIGSNETELFNDTTGFDKRASPAAEFFRYGVLGMQDSPGIHDVGAPRWQLALCVLVVYCTLYLSLFKGVKSSGKVVWVTATFPYVVLGILLIRGLMLPGALSGIAYYLQPDLSRLQYTQVWVEAAVQIFYSVGPGFGVHLSYASYNKFHNNCYRDCLITTAVNCFTSFFSGFVIFTYLGFMSHKHNVPISSVATEGPGLVFQVYPEAIATLPGSNVWSVLFFFMVITLGLDSGMGGLECIVTGLMDEFRWIFKGKRYAREIFTLCIVSTSFFVALVNVTPGGIYIFHLLDTYAAGVSLLASALFETFAVSWIYGLDRFSSDIKDMLGFAPGLYWRICWKIISPLFLIGVVVFGVAFREPLQYDRYTYPTWAEAIGWTMCFASFLMIPLIAVVQLLRTSGTFLQRVAINITPDDEREDMLRTGVITRFKMEHWLQI